MTQEISPSRKLARRIFILLALLAVACGGLAWWFLGRERPHDRRRGSPVGPTALDLRKLPLVERPLMGTGAQILVYAAEEDSARVAIEAAFQRGKEIEDICTDYDSASELRKLSSAPLNQPIPVSATLATVLTHARTTAEHTEGAFDPTFGPLTTLWRQSRRKKKLPAPDALQHAQDACGWEKFEVDLERKFVVLKQEGMRFDLGGIGKGFAADEMMRVLHEHGIYIAFIAIAGDVRLGAPPPGRSGWRVGIKTLGPELTQFIEVANCAVSTSGDLYQYVEIDGIRYSHIIDPATGLGLTTRVAATVVAPTAVQSDPLATFSCIRPKMAYELFRAGEISCRIVTLRNGVPVDEPTPQFPRVDAL